MGGRMTGIGAAVAASGLIAATLMAPGAREAAAQDATPAATVATSDQGGGKRQAAAAETPAAVGGNAPTTAPRAGVGPSMPATGDLASLLGVAAATAAVAASLLRERKSTSGR